jgi:RNA polymerase sigma-70 factor, ECF subfamily
LVYAPERTQNLVPLDSALQLHMEKDPRAGRVVELRFFGGLSAEETAEVLSLSVRTVEREWTFGRTWLRKQTGAW